MNIKITPTCYGINTQSSGSLQLCQLKLWIIKMIKYNIVVYHYDKILVNVAAYAIPGLVCVGHWSGVTINIP